MSPGHSMNLVGIEEQIKRTESLLCMESQEVRIIGIWGMGGIGKTTIARAVFDRICNQFEGFQFLANVRENLRRYTAVDLRNKLLSKILDEDNLLEQPPSLAVAFTKDCLRRKKVLIVLDDVDNSRQLQELSLGVHDLFGPGSKILVTSRDKQVLKKNGVDAIYKVQGLNNHDALRLLILNAFKKNCPKRDHIELLERMVDYAKGNPLALIVLGSSLYDRSKEKWYSALNKLGKVPNPEIQRVLRISYDGLDGEQQQIFLDIAFFFNGAEWNHAVKVLDSCYSSLQFDLSILIDKSLITISQNTLEMHDILQEMAYSIVREESKNPGKRSRLCDHEDIYHVLKKKKVNSIVCEYFFSLVSTGRYVS